MVEEDSAEPKDPPEIKQERTVTPSSVEGGTVFAPPPLSHSWSIPVTTGPYQRLPSDPSRSSGHQGPPITTGSTNVHKRQPENQAAELDGQTSASSSVKSGEDVDLVKMEEADEGRIGPSKQSESLERTTHDSGSRGLSASGGSGQQPPSSGGPKSTTQRRAYKKRSPRQTSLVEQESRKQRRLEKNRVTAAISRERKRVQFADLQQRVEELETDKKILEDNNERLAQELECRNKQLEIAKEELASLAKGASRPGLAQRPFESAELEDALPLVRMLKHRVSLPYLICPIACNRTPTFSLSEINFRFWMNIGVLILLVAIMALGWVFQMAFQHPFLLQFPLQQKPQSLSHRMPSIRNWDSVGHGLLWQWISSNEREWSSILAAQ